MKKEKIRLNKYIASAGLCSRRAADEYIRSGKIRVNGVVVTDFSYRVSDSDRITVENVRIKPEQKFTYIRYYKPAGYITTKNDENGRKTIYDALPESVQNLKPVGRLDKASTGLLIMTDDGDLINKMTHPKIKIPKVYRVAVEGKINQNDLIKLSKGIELVPGKIAYAQAEVVDFEDKNTVLTVVLYQGLNRQIRKMFEFVSHPVISLKRIQHGPIDIAGLQKGEFKYLRPQQITQLKNYINKFNQKSETEKLKINSPKKLKP